MSRKIALGILLFISLALVIFSAVFTRNYGVLPQAAYALFNTTEPLKATDRVLVVAPHQDDETIGTAGLIMQALQVKATVKVVYATDGNKHGEKAIRHQEAVAAMKSLGLQQGDLTFFDYPDSELSQQADFPAKLAVFITSYQPTIVATTLPQDLHHDHAACGQAVQDIWKNNKSFTPYFFLVHYHRFPRPASYHPEDYLLPPLRLISADYRWLALPLTSAQVDQKYTTTQLYKSQLEPTNPVLRELLFALVRQNEMFAIPRN